MQPLSKEQLHTYSEQGYLLVSGLIPETIAAAAEGTMWRALGLSPDDPAHWPESGGRHRIFAEPELTAVYTPDVCAAAAQLAGDGEVALLAPRRAYAINIFPGSAEWKWPEPHIDHAIREHGHKTFPRAFRVALMTFLNDVPPHGAGTVVWPGSHRRLEALARIDPQRYELMWSLNQDLERAGLGPPMELTPRRGDCLFYHYLCAHAGSMNTSHRPRFAFNAKW